MQKKTYLVPAVQIVEVLGVCQLMSGSGGHVSGESNPPAGVTVTDSESGGTVEQEDDPNGGWNSPFEPGFGGGLFD